MEGREGGRVRKGQYRGTDCYKYENMQKGERSNGGGKGGRRRYQRGGNRGTVAKVRREGMKLY